MGLVWFGYLDFFVHLFLFCLLFCFCIVDQSVGYAKRFPGRRLDFLFHSNTKLEFVVLIVN